MAELGIVAFIEARLAEDAAVIERNSDGRGLGDGFPDYRTYEDCDTQSADEYIRRFGPDRLLAEIEAKRRRLDLHRPDPNAWTPRCMTCLSDRAGRLSDDWEPDKWPCETILLDAASYADHADFAAAWRVE